MQTLMYSHTHTHTYIYPCTHRYTYRYTSTSIYHLLCHSAYTHPCERADGCTHTTYHLKTPCPTPSHM